MKTWLKWALAGAAVVLAAGTLTLRLAGRGTVLVTPVVRTAIVQSVVATGRINASARIDLGSEVTATVLDVTVREGDRVPAGALLVRLADAEARAALAQAQAALTEARQRASQQSAVAAPVADQAVVQAEAAYLAASQEQQRARDLVAQGFFAQQKLDDAQRVLDTARSALASARVQADANRAGGVEPGLAATRVAQAEAAVQAAQARLGRLHLHSPVDAVVLARHVEPGSLAQPGRVLLALAAQGALRIDAAIDEKNLRLLQAGMPARAVADADPGQAFDARLEAILPAVDPQRGTVEVRLAVPSAPAFLRPDMTVSVELLGGAKKDALVLPSGAVRDADRESPWVLVARDGVAVRVPVRLGLRGVGAVEIAQGLAEGELAIAPTEKALPGERVQVKTATVREKGMEVPAFISR
jgi:HlyD family secretion protein